MKKIFYLFAVLFTASILFTACRDDKPKPSDPSVTDEGVEINDVRWATRNVDMPGTFAPYPESFGMFYQWGGNIGWISTDYSVINSNGDDLWDVGWSSPIGSIWKQAQDPCPPNWRVPTSEEILSLYDADNIWTTQNGINGRLFGTAPNQIFLPASGIFNANGQFGLKGVRGEYWSSTPRGSFRWYLIFREDHIIMGGLHFGSEGLNIRCVAK